MSGEIVYSDGSHEPIEAASLIATPEGALSVLRLALFAASVAVLLTHWL